MASGLVVSDCLFFTMANGIGSPLVLLATILALAGCFSAGKVSKDSAFDVRSLPKTEGKTRFNGSLFY